MKCETKSLVGKLLITGAIGLASAALSVPQANAQTFKVIYNFTGLNDGGNPLDGLSADSAGNLYATTNTGGASGYGAVIKTTTSGTETVVHNFAGGTDGAYPEGGLIRDKAGNFYGTTTGGGASGQGTVFGITSKGKEQMLYSFTGGNDG